MKPLDELEATIAASVRTMRQERAVTQEEVTRAVNRLGLTWHKTTLCKIEAGSRALLFKEAVALCIVMGVDLEGIAQGEGS